MVSEWLRCMDKKPSDRTKKDLEIIFLRLSHTSIFQHLTPAFLEKLCYFGYYEDLESGVTLFRQGDMGKNWYTIISGSLEVQAINDEDNLGDRQTLCTLGIGTTFGESILEGKPHSTTIVTSDHCELLRVEQRDFKLLWEKNKQFMDGIISSSGMIRNGPRESNHIYTIKPNTPDEKNIYTLRDPSRNSNSAETFEMRGSPPANRIKSYDSRESLSSRRSSYDHRDSPGASAKHRNVYESRETVSRARPPFDPRESPTRRSYEGYEPIGRPRLAESPTRMRPSDHGSRELQMRSRPDMVNHGSPTRNRVFHDSNGSPHRRRSDFARHDSPIRGSTESLSRHRYNSSPKDFSVRRQYSLELRDSSPTQREFYSPNRKMYHQVDDYRDLPDRDHYNDYYNSSRQSPTRSRMQPDPRASPSSKQRFTREPPGPRHLDRCSSREYISSDPYSNSPTSHNGSFNERYVGNEYVEPESPRSRSRNSQYSDRSGAPIEPLNGGRIQDKKALSLPITSTTAPPVTRRSSISQSARRKEEAINEPKNIAMPLKQTPSEKLFKAGWVLRTVIMAHAGHMIRDRKYHMKTFNGSMVGTEMVDWLIQIGSHVHIVSRPQAVGIWQSLLEEGVISHVTHEHQFKDKYLFYRFCMDEDGSAAPITHHDGRMAEDELKDVLVMLTQLGPDAMLRMILTKKPNERTEEDLEIINEELIHIEALSHLSSSVKKELTSVLQFESHPRANTVLFNQGDEGKSWYIILKGSVNVVIYGKGVVSSLHEGDDFGKLALINDAPRAASIVLREDNCHFLRVDKDDFNRILRDVEANTVRLKEHGKDVLVLEKIPSGSTVDRGSQSHYKYSVMAGTPQKMLEYLLEARMDSKLEDIQDSFIEDFLLTHVTFMPSQQLCSELIRYYRTEPNQSADIEFMMSSKRRVIQFVRYWVDVIHEPLFEDTVVDAFVSDLYEMVRIDDKKYGTLDEELRMIAKVHEEKQRFLDREQQKPVQKWKVSSGGQIKQLCDNGSQDHDRMERHLVMKSKDEIIFRVYCADHTYTTMKTLVGATTESVKKAAAEKSGLTGDLSLVEVKSSGDKVTFKDSDVSIPTLLSVNGRIFITPSDNIESLTPTREQEGPSQSSMQMLEVLGSRELAFELTLYDWDLFSCIHEYELIYHVFGRHNFKRITSNLDIFLRRFNEVQYWVVTEMCLTNTISKRVQLLRKFLKIADYCREYQNMNTFFAIIMGLSNVAVSRMTSTWDRLNSKVRRTFTEFEAIIDPSRNHRAYRLSVAKMSPPIIPFMPLLMKDMTFTHEGNKTNNEGLINFEKMHMISHTLRTMEHCRSEPFYADPPSSLKNEQEIREYIRNLKVIDNQKRIGQLSQKIEGRR